ncbi:MAG: hypothetical protein Q8K63_12420 [Acidimicrobiales bacterium]|nr:hypothetical protein [Acidimicrobiales bacterium]
MTDETPGNETTQDATQVPSPEAPPTPDPASPSATGEAWSEVVASMSELGAALSAWAKSAADDPQNKARLESVRAGVDEMARQADIAIGKVTSTEFGQQVSQGAQQAGDAIGGAAQQVSDAAAPHVATALSGMASLFGRAAAKVDEAVNRERNAEQPAEQAPTAPAAAPAPASSVPEPPAEADQS